MKVHIIAGELNGLHGPLEVIDTKPTFFDVELNPNEEFIYNLDPSFKSFAFLVEGEVNFNVEREEIVSSPKGVLYGEGDIIKINTKDKKARFLLLIGKPLNEEIAWDGPIVMNTKEELQLAFKELDEGKFIK